MPPDAPLAVPPPPDALPPLPFRVPVPSLDSVGLDGIREESAVVEGHLHLDVATVGLEWRVRRRIEVVGFTGVEVTDRPSPVEWFDLPLTALADVRLIGGWWAPRVVLRATRLDAFDVLTWATSGALRLRIARRDRALATRLVDALRLSADGRLGPGGRIAR